MSKRHPRIDYCDLEIVATGAEVLIREMDVAVTPKLCELKSLRNKIALIESELTPYRIERARLAAMVAKLQAARASCRSLAINCEVEP